MIMDFPVKSAGVMSTQSSWCILRRVSPTLRKSTTAEEKKINLIELSSDG